MDTTELRAIWQTISGLQSTYQLSATELEAITNDMPREDLQRGLVQQDVPVSAEMKRNVSLLLGIHSGLQILFSDTVQATTWIDRPNSLPPFNGDTPRILMFSGSETALAGVRAFIDYWLQ